MSNKRYNRSRAVDDVFEEAASDLRESAKACHARGGGLGCSLLDVAAEVVQRVGPALSRHRDAGAVLGATLARKAKVAEQEAEAGAKSTVDANEPKPAADAPGVSGMAAPDDDEGGSDERR